MADDSDSGSVLSSVSELSVDKKTDEKKRCYALYTVCQNRPHSTSESEGTEEAGNGNVSLSVVATNLAASAETDLRKALGQKLSRNVDLTPVNGFLSVGLSSADDTSVAASCFYSVLVAGTSSSPQSQQQPPQPSTTPDPHFLVCFVSYTDSSLDLFRNELEQYSNGMVTLLDAELSQVNTSVKDYLEQWHATVLDFIPRCLLRFGDNVRYLVYAALLDAAVELKGGTQQEQDDIRKFIQCCSLSSLLRRMQGDGGDTAGCDSMVADSLVDVSEGSSFGVQASLSLQNDKIIMDAQGFTPDHFCTVAAEHLLAIDVNNITKLRESLESVKLGFIHNLNKLKRFVKQAEVDLYALYRACLFLRTCGSGGLLLRYIKLDASPETLKVLAALEEFFRQNQEVLT